MVRFESSESQSVILEEHPHRPCYCREGKGFWHNDRDVCDGCGGSLVLGPWQPLGFLREDLDEYLIVVDDGEE